MPTRPAGRPRRASTARTRAITFKDKAGWPGWAFTTTGQPAARALAVSPPSTEKAKGKLLAANMATGPSGTRWRHMAGCPAGGAPGTAGSSTRAKGRPCSARSAKRRS